MAEDQLRPGRITKVVRVSFALDEDGRGLYGCNGYGILQDDDGHDVFFVDSAVQNTPFSELESGQQADYLLETGPLKRAVKVWLKGCVREGTRGEQL